MYDVIIVGARVAGSSLAILLGRQGLRVLLLDRDRFPSGTLSTHLLTPAAVASLRGLGVLADVEAVGLRRLYRLRTALGDCVVEGPLREPNAYALCARRDRLDMTLIEHALRQPTVAFREATRVDGLLPGYHGTLTYTRTGDVPGKEIAWLQVLASNAGFVRQLGMGISTALRAPGVLPAGIAAAIERSAGRFAASVETAMDGLQAGRSARDWSLRRLCPGRRAVGRGTLRGLPGCGPVR